jgi:hypothetical protein
MNELTNLARRLLSEKRDRFGQVPPLDQPSDIAEQHAPKSGSLVWWRSMNGHEHGPAVVEGTFRDHQDMWFWCRCNGQDFLVNTRLIMS